MAKSLSEAKESEFEDLSKFIEYYSTFYNGIERNSEIHPSNILVKIITQFGRPKALEGLKQAVNDTIEATQHFSPTKIYEIDLALKNNGIITLSAIRQKYWTKYKRIVSRKSIKNETEYYLVAGILKSVPETFSATDYELLGKMTNEFEQKYALNNT